MKHPLFYPAVFLACGALCGGLFQFQPAAIEVVFCLMLLVAWLLRGKGSGYTVLCAAFFFFGSMHAGIRTPTSGEAAELQVPGRVSIEGTVLSEPDILHSGKRVRSSFVMKTETIYNYVEGKGNVRKSESLAQVYLYQPDGLPLPGDRVRIYGSIKFPEPAGNPGEFDYRRYLELHGITQIISGYGMSALTILETAPQMSPAVIVYQLRNVLRRRISDLFSPGKSGIIRALILGDRSMISEEVRELFASTGTAHLLAISGVHLMILSGLVMSLCVLCGLPSRGVAVCGILFMMIYCAVGGGGIPLRRASMTGVMSLVALTAARRVNRLNILALVLLVFVLIDPRVLKHLSFQLSFISVCALMLSARPMRAGSLEPLPWGLQPLLAVTAATVPLTMYYFNLIPLISLPANLIAVPLFYLCLFFTVLSLIAGALPVIGSLLVQFTEMQYDISLEWIRFSSQFPGAFYYVSSPNLAILLLYYLFFMSFLALLYSRRAGVNRLTAATVSGMCLSFMLMISGGQREIKDLTFLAVRDHFILYLKTEDNVHWMIAAGSGLNDTSVRRVLRPFLESRGTARSQRFLFSGSDEAFRRTKEVTRSSKAMQAPEALVFPGMHYRISENIFVRFVLVEEESRVLIIDYFDRRVMALPDVNPRVLAWLLGNPEEGKNISVLCMPSDSYSKKELIQKIIQKIKPEAVILEKNSENESLPAVIQRKYPPVFALAGTGAIRLKVEEEGVVLTSHNYGQLKAF